MPRGLGHGGGHTTWTCRKCDQTVYGPPINTHCTALDGPAVVRISNATYIPNGGGPSSCPRMYDRYTLVCVHAMTGQVPPVGPSYSLGGEPEQRRT